LPPERQLPILNRRGGNPSEPERCHGNLPLLAPKAARR